MICYVACHREDAKWMVGETVPFAKHAFRTTGYDLKSVVEFAAGQGLVVLKIEAGGVLKPVL